MEELLHIIFLFYLACDLYTPGGFSARPAADTAIKAAAAAVKSCDPVGAGASSGVL